MKQIKQNMSKETDELDNEEENEELFGDISKDDLSREILSSLQTHMRMLQVPNLTHTKTFIVRDCKVTTLAECSVFQLGLLLIKKGHRSFLLADFNKTLGQILMRLCVHQTV